MTKITTSNPNTQYLNREYFVKILRIVAIVDERQTTLHVERKKESIDLLIFFQTWSPVASRIVISGDFFLDFVYLFWIFRIFFGFWVSRIGFRLSFLVALAGITRINRQRYPKSIQRYSKSEKRYPRTEKCNPKSNYSLTSLKRPPPSHLRWSTNERCSRYREIRLYFWYPKNNASSFKLIVL